LVLNLADLVDKNWYFAALFICLIKCVGEEWIEV